MQNIRTEKISPECSKNSKVLHFSLLLANHPSILSAKKKTFSYETSAQLAAIRKTSRPKITHSIHIKYLFLGIFWFLLAKFDLKNQYFCFANYKLRRYERGERDCNQLFKHAKKFAQNLQNEKLTKKPVTIETEKNIKKQTHLQRILH